MIGSVTQFWWEADDDSLHRTQLERDAKNAELGVRKWMEGRGIGRGGEWSADMILRALLEDAPILSGLLEAFVDAGGASRA